MNDNRVRGRLKVYDSMKGFGFIERDQGRNVFVHYLDLDGGTDAAAIIGAILEFEVEDGPKGPRARNVQVVA